MKLRDLFTQLASDAGIAADDANLTALAAKIPEDAEADDETIVKPIRENLLTVSAAENNEKIKGKFTALALNGVDATIDPVLVELLGEEGAKTFKAENKTTHKRVAKLLEQFKAQKKGGDTSEAAKTITELNNQLAQIKTTHDTELQTLKDSFARDRFYDRLKIKIVNRADVVDLAKEEDGLLALTALDKKLGAVGGVLDVNTGKIMKKEDPTLELFINNKPATVDGLLDDTLKERKYIKASNPAPTNPVEVPADDKGGQGASAAQAKMASYLKDE
ncbi:hypothetical protein FAES_1821 [Fibrella aestuarina BUZ 2]|uniref:Uncharacterized protein n=1 Tax=Fibrella aestuarina BUZ 2 TaxID=1166018 RepID=I0K6S8_9BACT|nr:hypothetical protein [Fibrella aestuarina]CCG99831.1 hypothetical protein FAES_1821 [Fibrella aestuarina BUZ 2]